MMKYKAFSKISNMHEHKSDGMMTCDVNMQSLKKQVGTTKEIRLQVEKQIKDCNVENAELKSKVEKIIEEQGLLYGFN